MWALPGGSVLDPLVWGLWGDGGLGVLWMNSQFPQCPGIVLRHSHPSLWQHGLGKGFGAPASTGHILPKTDPVLIQNLASVWSHLREGKGEGDIRVLWELLPSPVSPSCPALPTAGL